MSNLQSMLLEAKAGLAPWQRVPETKWQEIAAQCGPQEVQEIYARIASLKAELLTVEDWDGDTQDDINLTIAFFNGLLQLTGGSRL
ncbi:hypothetical protein H1235_10175 [Pseudoxanthomonas sp. NC8]|nr:hypothetical protein H1235_10175 [Pseudoxanthomonas sp. NC8]